MANFLITPNMNLPNPVPGVDPGPDYATNIQSSLNQIDQHNHSSGQGVQIQPNGLNISSDLTFNGTNAISLRSVRFLSQMVPIPNTAPDVGIVYVSGNELWYNDYTGGNQVQLTSNGLINATSSGISSGTATAAFSAGTLVVKSSAFSFANVDLQSVILANSGNLVNQLILQAPVLSSSYTISLPYTPSQLSVMTLDSAGNMSTTINATAADPVGQAMSSIGANAIATSMTSAGTDAIIATMGSSGANAIANNRTRAVGTTVGAGGIARAPNSGLDSTSSASPVLVAGQSISITTTGRPVYVTVIPDPTATVGNSAKINANTAVGNFYIVSSLNSRILTIDLIAPYPPGVLNAMDVVPAGTYTYQLFFSNSAGGTTQAFNLNLIAYEL